MTSALSSNLRTMATPAIFAATHIKAAALQVGNFFYGDEKRTKRSITFAYMAITLYLLAVINADHLASCAL